MAPKNTAERCAPFVLSFLALIAGCATLGFGAGALPEIKKNCASCHVDISKGPALHKPLSELCLDCHPGRKSPGDHRVDIIPSMPVRSLPLFQGKMTCVTCHDPHGNRYGMLLRVEPKKLCLQCHRK